jgi:transcriptional regulator with XRE-family HTH domain
MPTAVSRTEELRGLLTRATTLDVRQDAEFQTVMREAPGTLELSEKQIADALSVSRPTFNRWINGKSLPHIAMRTPAVQWLIHELNTRIKNRGGYSRGSGSESYPHAAGLVAMGR